MFTHVYTNTHILFKIKHFCTWKINRKHKPQIGNKIFAPINNKKAIDPKYVKKGYKSKKERQINQKKNGQKTNRYFTQKENEWLQTCQRLRPTPLAFTWQDPETHVSQQLTWTVLPQGFRDSPHFFGQALQKDLQTLDLAPSHLLQYVDDLLLCSPTRKLCLQHTAKLLGALRSWGYRVSQSKAQIAQTNVTYLGLSISHQQRTIPPDRIQALINCPLPKTKRELLSISAS